MAGLPDSISARFAMMHNWENLGGGMARVRQFNQRLSGVGYVTKCLELQLGHFGGDVYELQKFGSLSCQLTLSNSLLHAARRGRIMIARFYVACASNCNA